MSRIVPPHTTAAPDLWPARAHWHPALDPLAREVLRLVLDHLDRYAPTLGVDDVALLDEATMQACIRTAAATAVDHWLTTRPVSAGGLVLDPPPPPRQAAA